MRRQRRQQGIQIPIVQMSLWISDQLFSDSTKRYLSLQVFQTRSMEDKVDFSKKYAERGVTMKYQRSKVACRPCCLAILHTSVADQKGIRSSLFENRAHCCKHVILEPVLLYIVILSSATTAVISM